MEILADRRLGPIEAQLVRDFEGVYIDLALEAEGYSWSGVASFPVFMEEFALYRLDKIRTINDVEDVVRAWSGAETWASLHIFRADTGL